MRPFIVFALLVSLPVASRACMNDRDSDALVIQNKRLPDAIRVISGRFERNPPRYYQMRIARVEGELKSNPRHFGLYDDLAVAHDRLGDDGTAMRVMAQKRALLPAFNARDKALKEAWYRYFANDGTFRAHRFLHDGAKVARIGEMKQAREEIRRAIQIKPNAHFGRERVQLMVMDWIVARKQKKTSKTLGAWIEGRDGEKYRHETAEGLAGLVVLGAAWNSPDVFEALANALDVPETIALRYLALLRCRELLESKKSSLAGLSVPTINAALTDSGGWGDEGIGINRQNQQSLDELYPQLRQEADQWNASRAKWMETKFAQDQHPDTNTNFWEGFPETEPPSLDINWFNQRGDMNRAILFSITLVLSLVFGIPALAIVFWVKYLRKRARRNTSAA
ncbi:hypothetical protein IAD21_00997 [Abditibacteriota bacterium]|nr:hypothetical protein IAD21_00997 [Abditibacteriota bacterium]